MEDIYTQYDKYLKAVPVMPEIATKIITMTEEKLDVSFKELENIIKVDPGLTAKVLKVANSALYARQREITNLQIAITLLGFKNIRSLVLLITAASLFTQLKQTEFYQRFWKHAIITAFLAKHIAIKTSQTELADDLFTAGLLHKIGKVALFNADKSKYNELIKASITGNLSILELEKAAFGLNHKELGSSILSKWFFPSLYVDTAREIGNRNITSSHKSAIVYCTLACLLTELVGFGYGTPEKKELIDHFLLHTELKKEDITYYQEHYIDDLAQDPLFQECKFLFNLA